MANIIISPFSRHLRNGKENPKNYPFWGELIKLLSTLQSNDGKGFLQPVNKIIQLGQTGDTVLVEDFRFNLPMKDIVGLVKACDFFISVDTFLPHLAHYYGKQGIVLWGQSDPKLFGYVENINLLKGTNYLRKHQLQTWEQATYNENAFVKPEVVIDAIKYLEWKKNG